MSTLMEGKVSRLVAVVVALASTLTLVAAQWASVPRVSSSRCCVSSQSSSAWAWRASAAALLSSHLPWLYSLWRYRTLAGMLRSCNPRANRNA
jgi:hypothetical protein